MNAQRTTNQNLSEESPPMIPHPRGNPLGFTAAQAIEHAAFRSGSAPESAHLLLVPLWRVEIQAQVTTAEPYQLIDRYLVRGIAEAGLTTPADLAAFFALDPPLTRQALSHLREVGHLTDRDGHLTLTQLGEQSWKAGRKYIVVPDDRRTVHFDAWTGTPLPDSPEAPHQAAPLSAWTSAPPLLAPDPFRPESAAALAEPGVADPKALSWDAVYVLAWVLRTRDGHHLVCTRPHRGAPDPTLSRALDEAPTCLPALTDANARAQRAFPEETARWLSRRGIAYREVGERVGETGEPRESPLPRVPLPPSAYADPDLTLGAVIVLDSGGFFQLWCDDPAARRAELLRRLAAYRAARPRDAAALRTHTLRLATQLDVSPECADTPAEPPVNHP